MKFEEFESLLDSIRRGCLNRMGDMEPSSDTKEFNWYSKRHNEISGILMSLQSEYYSDDEP